MPYRAAKISFDGSHYIATPKENFPQGHKRRRASLPPTPKEVAQKEQFEVAYKESQKLPRKERKTYMRKAMEGELNQFVFRPESVNGNALPVKGKVHCLRQPLTESNLIICSGQYNAFPFVFSPSKDRKNEFIGG